MKRCYASDDAKRKKREPAVGLNDGSKQRNSFDAFISHRHVNDQNTVSFMDNPDAEDIRNNTAVLSKKAVTAKSPFRDKLKNK